MPDVDVKIGQEDDAPIVITADDLKCVLLPGRLFQYKRCDLCTNGRSLVF